MTRITILGDETCFFSAIAVAHEVFTMANGWWKAVRPEAREPLFEVEYTTKDGQPAAGSGSLILQPDKPMHEIERTDIVVIPPFSNRIRWTLNRMTDVVEWIRTQYERGAMVAAMCTGTFLLAETGLLDGKRATTNWHFVRSFEKRFPRVNLQAREILTEEDGLVCSGTTTAYLDLFLHLVRKFGSDEIATKISKTWLMEPRRQSQAPYMVFERHRNHNDADILEAQQWMDDHMSEPIVIDEIAGLVAISPRHFKRRFREAVGESPLKYLQKIRIETAKEKLATTLDNFNEITWQVGYEDSNSFRKLFKKHTSLSPSDYRMKFSQRNPVERI